MAILSVMRSVGHGFNSWWWCFILLINSKESWLILVDSWLVLVDSWLVLVDSWWIPGLSWLILVDSWLVLACPGGFLVP